MTKNRTLPCFKIGIALHILLGKSKANRIILGMRTERMFRL
jgi:hypothetical protein